MSLYDLPIEVFRIVLAEMVITVGIIHAIRLRLVCRLFNQEIPSAICMTNLFEKDPKGAKVPPESGLPVEYLFRLTANAKTRARDLPALINRVVRCLLTVDGDQEILQSVQDSYTRALCGVAATHLYTQNPEYLRYPPAASDSGAPGDNLDNTSIHILAAAAFFGFDQFFIDLPKEKVISDMSSQYFGYPLVLAAHKNNYQITKILLERDGKESRGNHKRLALRAAARAGHENIVQLLLLPQHVQGKRDDLYKDAGIEAVKGGHAHLAQSLFKQGSINVTASMQTQILESAVHYGHEDIVREALENLADPNSNEPRDTALTQAAMKGHTKIARLLISHGADVNPRGGIWTPLFRAAERGYRELAQILLENGADIDGWEWRRPLSAAASHGQDEMFSFLVKAGADVSYLEQEPGFPLAQAALGGYETMIHILISHGVNIKAAGEKAVINAMLGGHDNIVNILLGFGVEKPHSSVLVKHLHKSAKSGFEDWVRNLIAQGVDMDAPHPILNATPLWIATRFNHPHLSKTLVELGAKYSLPTR